MQTASVDFSVVPPVGDTTPPLLQLSDITADATSPAGADVFVRTQALDNSDPSPRVTCAAGSVNLTNYGDAIQGVFPIGSTAVACSATDDSGNSAQAGFVVTVRGAREQLGNLRAATTVIAHAGIVQSLGTKLDLAAEPSLPAPAGCSALTAFANEVGGLSGTLVAVDLASSLVASATRIQAVLSCAR